MLPGLARYHSAVGYFAVFSVTHFISDRAKLAMKEVESNPKASYSDISRALGKKRSLVRDVIKRDLALRPSYRSAYGGRLFFFGACIA